MPTECRYCRDCGYDLRGQVDPRCPECATPFDPADPSTFDNRPLTKLGRFIRGVCTRDVVILVILTLLLIASYAARLLLPDICHDRVPIYETMSHHNVGFVIRLWRGGLQADPANAQAALDRAIAAAPLFYSFKTQTGRMRDRRIWMERCGKGASLTAHLIPYGLLIVLACRKRIAAFGAVILVTSLAVVLLCGMAQSNPPRAYMPDRAYVNDYLYLVDVDWTEAATTPRVAAFEKPPWSDRVTVGLTDGGVRWLTVEEFRCLAEAEGFADRLPP
ncbi:MAG: hypothetical protein IT449_12955 [Phycisphaerales bacterium]|nr:hypothetical protein [Phycisphaerales bacterium]